MLKSAGMSRHNEPVRVLAVFGSATMEAKGRMKVMVQTRVSHTVRGSAVNIDRGGFVWAVGGSEVVSRTAATVLVFSLQCFEAFHSVILCQLREWGVTSVPPAASL